MAYTEAQLTALETALAKGEKRVSFGDKTVEYRTRRGAAAGDRCREARSACPGGGHRTCGRRLRGRFV